MSEELAEQEESNKKKRLDQVVSKMNMKAQAELVKKVEDELDEKDKPIKNVLGQVKK